MYYNCIQTADGNEPEMKYDSCEKTPIIIGVVITVIGVVVGVLSGVIVAFVIVRKQR